MKNERIFVTDKTLILPNNIVIYKLIPTWYCVEKGYIYTLHFL